MVQSMIRAEVSEIADLPDCFDGRDGVFDLPEGHGEMPTEIKQRLAAEVESLRGMYSDGVIDGGEMVEAFRCVVKLAFLMGRRFGTLETAAGVQNVSRTVKMTKGVLVSCLIASGFLTSFGVGC